MRQDLFPEFAYQHANKVVHGVVGAAIELINEKLAELDKRTGGPVILVFKIPSGYTSERIEELTKHITLKNLGVDSAIVIKTTEVTDVTVEQLVPTLTKEEVEALLEKVKAK
jgi:hypothetical protein